MLLILMLHIFGLVCKTEAIAIKYNGDALDALTGCGTGYYSVYPDPVSCECEPCLEGTYNDRDSTQSCTSCPSEWTTLQPGATSITTCQQICGKGYYSKETGTSHLDRTCTIYPIGSYTDTDTAINCIHCPENQTTAQGGSTTSSQCGCTYGYFLDTTTDECTICPVGTYTDSINQESCTPCPEGQITSGEGDSACRPSCNPGYKRNGYHCVICPDETYTDTDNAESCHDCPVNYFTFQAGSTRCYELCQAGYWKHPDDLKCYPCPLGTYGESHHDDLCYRCPLGTITLTTGATSRSSCFTECSSGYIFNSTTLICTICPFRTYSGGYPAESCTDCPRNQTTAQEGRSTSSHCGCSYGYYWDPTTDSCFICPVGTYSETINTDESCTHCPDGQTTASEGSNELDACRPSCNLGYKWNGHQCAICPDETYSDTENTESCLDCPPNQFTFQAGSSQCYELCQAGYWNHPDDLKCYPCPLGTYRESHHDNLCVRCPLGTTTDSTGAPSRQSCH